MEVASVTKYKWYWMPVSEKWRWIVITFWSLWLVITIAQIPNEGPVGLIWATILVIWIFEYLFRPSYDER